MEPELFTRALFSWDEFWSTIRTGWRLLGDPLFSPTEKLEKWLLEPALIGPDEYENWTKAWITQMFWEPLMKEYPLSPIWITDLQLKIPETSEKDLQRIKRILRTYPRQLPENVLFFSALTSTEVTMENFKVDGSTLNEIPQEIKVAIEEEFGKPLEQLPQDVLEALSEDLKGGFLIPTRLGAVCLLAHRSMDWLGFPIGGLSEWNYPSHHYWIYAFSRGKLNPLWPFPSPSMKTYAGYPFLGEFEEAFRKVSGEGQRLDEVELEQLLIPGEDEFGNKYEEFSHNPRHPLHRFISAAKFKGKSLWNVEESRRIDEEIKACFTRSEKVEELLIREMEKDEDMIRYFGQLLRSQGRKKFLESFSKRADKIYRRMYERFRRRGIRMPTPPEGWRGKAEQQILLNISRKESKRL